MPGLLERLTDFVGDDPRNPCNPRLSFQTSRDADAGRDLIGSRPGAAV
jgi:hypothetical protein